MLKKIIKKYLRPFWFAHDCEHIKVPYFYGTLLILFLFVSVTFFTLMAWREYPAGVLGSTSAVIATLAGLYVGVLKLYETGGGKK